MANQSSVYEGLFLFDANKYARDPGKLSGKVNQLVADAGGTMMASRLWEERRLAYAINGQRKGTYWISYFRVDGTKLANLNRQIQISDGILRHLFVKVDPRLVDALVSHAQAGSRPQPGAQEEGKPSEKADRQEIGGDTPAEGGAEAGETVASAAKPDEGI